MAVLALALQLSVPLVASGQNVTNWIAFNEHAPSIRTDPNVSAYNMRGFVLAADPGTVHPLAGPLTNYVTGDSGYAPGQSLNARLVASTLLRDPALFPNAALGYPNVGTPAYEVFMPGGAHITDLANAGSGIGLGNFSGGVGQDTVVLTFNRKFEGKEKGLVVDYIGIKKQMNLALAQYNKADSQNFEDIQASIVVVKDHLDLLAKIFHKFDSDKYFKGSALDQLHAKYGSRICSGNTRT